MFGQDCWAVMAVRHVPKGETIENTKDGLKRSEPLMTPGRTLVHGVHNPSAGFMHNASHNGITTFRLELNRRITHPEKSFFPNPRTR